MIEIETNVKVNGVLALTFVHIPNQPNDKFVWVAHPGMALFDSDTHIVLESLEIKPSGRVIEIIGPAET